MIPSKYFGFPGSMLIKCFRKVFSQIPSNYFFHLQCFVIAHSRNLSEKNLNSSYKLFFWGSSHLNMVFITE